jgi:tetratricopeptide (TPR) repeat protein
VIFRCTDSRFKKEWSAALAVQLPLKQTRAALAAEVKSLTSGAKARSKMTAFNARLKACSTCCWLCVTAKSALVLIALLGTPAVHAQSKPSQDFASLSARANAARDANRLDEASSLYKQALALRPSWAEGWWSLGTIQYDTNAYAQAAKSFQKLVAIQPKNGMAHAMLGLSQFETGLDDSALQHLEAATNLGISSDPELRRVLVYHEAVLLQRSEKFERAQSLLQQLCLEGTTSPEIDSALGMTLLRMSAKAPPTTGTPDANVVAGIGHAGCLVGQKKYEDAKTILNGLNTQYPQFLNIHYASGLLLLDTGDSDAAIAQFKAEIQNQPQDVIARLKIAAAEYKVDSAAGIPYAEEALKIDPHAALGQYLLGLLLLDTGDYKRAIPELEAARASLPNEARLYFALGSAYSMAGRKDDAARARATFQRLSEEQTKENR